MLLTMLDLTWIVRVYPQGGGNPRWSWYYTFTRKGAVSWRDPYNGMHGNGSWRIENDSMITRWTGSKTWEEWDVPINPDAATGTCHMSEGTFDIRAVAQNYYLQPGDVVYAGQPIIAGNGTVASVVYENEVRTGGTVAWICKNPGNIRDGAKYGAYKGKHLQVKGVGGYAIFPDESTGLNAVVTVLRGFGRVTINQAMHKYAPKGDGKNDPDAYARTIAARLRVSDTALLSTVDLTQMAKVITGVETTTGGTTWVRSGQSVPDEIRKRLSRPL